MNIQIDDLLVTQNALRDTSQLSDMVRFVQAGGHFSKYARLAWVVVAKRKLEPPPIFVAIMEDGRFVLHDGHHRTTAMHLAGRTEIYDDEYETGRYTYADYAEPHPEKGWFTPFNLETEVRVADFGAYRRRADKIYHQDGMRNCLWFIGRNRHLFAEQRIIRSVHQLSRRYETCLCAPTAPIAPTTTTAESTKTSLNAAQSVGSY